MALPKINHPTFETNLPSSGKKITFRPFTGREQKVLLVAKESNDTKDTLRAVAQVITNCCGIDALELPVFDIEYLFLMLRAKSVNNKVQVRIKDEIDGELYDATVDIDAAKINKATGSNKVEITGSIGMKLKYPTVSSVLAGSADTDEWDVLAASIDSIWDGEEITTSADMTRPELKEWLINLPLKTIEPIREFFENRPKISISVSYARKDGTEVTRELSGLQDFFE